MPQQMDFSSLTHELSHTGGAVDLYGVWNRESLNVGMTVMSSTLSSPPDDKKSIYHLDPWQRFKLGWIETIVLQGGDRVELGDEEWRDAQGEHARPLIVWRSAE